MRVEHSCWEVQASPLNLLQLHPGADSPPAAAFALAVRPLGDGLGEGFESCAEALKPTNSLD